MNATVKERALQMGSFIQTTMFLIAILIYKIYLKSLYTKSTFHNGFQAMVLRPKAMKY